VPFSEDNRAKKAPDPFSAPVIALGAVTDEFSPTDLDVALQAMAELGMTYAELRLVFGKNIIDLTDEEIQRTRSAVEAHGMKILSLASPLLKCVLPNAPPVDPRIQQDSFAASHTFDDQPQLTRRAFEIAERTGARIIRVFSYWRTVDPHECFDRVVSALRGLANEARDRGIVIGLENEHACNIATGEETARVLAALDHAALKVIWDPANAFVAGERPYPEGYSKLPPSRIVHVHAKDCDVRGEYTPIWGPLGEMSIDWKGQIGALVRDGYRGAISLETHWAGPGGDKLRGSIICGRTLSELVRHARVSKK
jgi:L-ribulose-5-phosphate 3-epimerase